MAFHENGNYLDDIIDLTNLAGIANIHMKREAKAVIPACGRGGPPPKLADFKIPRELEYLVPAKFQTANVPNSPQPKTKGRGRISIYQQENQHCYNFGITQQCEQFLGESHRNDAMLDLDRYLNDNEECDDPLFNIRLRRASQDENISVLKAPSAKITINPLAPAFIPEGCSSGGMTDVLPKSNLIPEQFTDDLNCDILNGHYDAQPAEELKSDKKECSKLVFNPAAPVFTPRNVLTCETDIRETVSLFKPNEAWSQLDDDFVDKDNFSSDKEHSAGTLDHTASAKPNSGFQASNSSEHLFGVGNSSGSDESSSTVVRSGGSTQKSDSDTLMGHNSSQDDNKNAPEYSRDTKTSHPRYTLQERTREDSASRVYNGGGARPKKWSKTAKKKTEAEVSCIQPIKSIYGNWEYGDNHPVDAFGRPCVGSSVNWNIEKDFPILHSASESTQTTSCAIADSKSTNEGCVTGTPSSNSASGYYLLMENLAPAHNTEVLKTMLSNFGTITEIHMIPKANDCSALIRVLEAEARLQIISCLDNIHVSADSDKALRVTDFNSSDVAKLYPKGLQLV